MLFLGCQIQILCHTRYHYLADIQKPLMYSGVCQKHQINVCIQMLKPEAAVLQNASQVPENVDHYNLSGIAGNSSLLEK